MKRKNVMVVILVVLAVVSVIFIKVVFFDNEYSKMSFHQIVEDNLDEKDTVKNLVDYRHSLFEAFNKYSVEMKEESFDKNKAIAKSTMIVKEESEIGASTEYIIDVVYQNGKLDNLVLTLYGDSGANPDFDKYINKDVYNDIAGKLGIDLSLDDIKDKTSLLKRDYKYDYVYNEEGKYNLSLLHDPVEVVNEPDVMFEYTYTISLK